MGAGHVRRKPNGSWEAIVYAGRDPVTGRKRQVSRSAPTKRAAQQLAAALVVELNAGTPTEGTFAHLVERWLATADLSPSTRMSYQRYLNNHILPVLGPVPLQRIQPAALDDLYLALRRRLAPASVKKVHGIIARALAQAVRWGWLAVNPASRAQPPRAGRTEVVAPAAADVARLLACAAESDPDLFVYVRLAAVTGARRGELVALRWSDVNFAQGEVTIRRGRVHSLDGPIVERTTKTGRARTVALDPTTVQILDEHRVRCEFRAMTAEATVTGGYLFTTADLEPWRPDGATSRFRRLRARAGLPTVRLHDLRHFAATSALAAGEPVRTVSGRLGHARASTTHDIYAHWVRESDRSTANALGRLLDGEQ